MWPKGHGQHAETLTATVWFYVYVSLTAAAQLLTRRLCGAAGCLCSTSSADCHKKKKKEPGKRGLISRRLHSAGN